MRSTTYINAVNAGEILYVSTTAGSIENFAPSSTGQVVRIVGYTVFASGTDLIYFCPDNTWVQIT
jgi:hypothetical protein